MHVVLWLKRASKAQGVIQPDPTNACQGEIAVTVLPRGKGQIHICMYIHSHSLSFITCPLFLNTTQTVLAKYMHLAEDVFLSLMIYMGVKLL